MEIKEKCCEYKVKENQFAKDGDSFPAVLQKYLDRIIKKEGYITYDVDKRNFSTEGGNYLAELYEVDIKGKTTNGDKVTNIFIKHIIPSDHIKMFSVSEAYLKESFMYNEVLKIYNDLQDEANVPAIDRFKVANSYSESNSEAILLENLVKKGFDTCYRMDVVPLKFAELSIQQLAKFHALSYVLQNRRPDYFNRNIKSCKQPFRCNDELKLFSENQSKLVCDALDECCKTKVEKYISTHWQTFREYLEDNDSSSCCLAHGDYRPNNILMKEEEGEVKEVIPVDFQICYYGCPINDFLYFIFLATDQEFRRQHLTNLKDLYHNTLDRFLRYFDMDVKKIYPRNEFENQYREKLEYGLMTAFFLLPFCFVTEDEVPDIGSTELSKLSFNVDSKYAKRIQGIVDDFIQWGYL